MLDMNMEMEADLGIDTVKQATIFSILGEKFNLGDKNANISQYKTIGSIVDLVSQSAGKGLKETADLGGETYSSNVVNILSILKNRLTNLKAAYKQASLEAKMQRVCPE